MHQVIHKAYQKAAVTRPSTRDTEIKQCQLILDFWLNRTRETVVISRYTTLTLLKHQKGHVSGDRAITCSKASITPVFITCKTVPHRDPQGRQIYLNSLGNTLDLPQIQSNKVQKGLIHISYDHLETKHQYILEKENRIQFLQHIIYSFQYQSDITVRVMKQTCCQEKKQLIRTDPEAICMLELANKAGFYFLLLLYQEID